LIAELNHEEFVLAEGPSNWATTFISISIRATESHFTSARAKEVGYSVTFTTRVTAKRSE